jgi:GNAT superfamily N-acetyltransferase
VNTEIQIKAIGPPQRDLLVTMYDRFDPLGAALGLPPRTAEARHKWIGSAMGQMVNLAAFSPAGQVVGHCFLAADKPGSAEMAVFVHQETRRRGIGATLIEKALEWGWAADLVRVWAVTTCDNRPALRLLMRCGFRLRPSAIALAELDIDLPVPRAAREMLAAASGSLVRRARGEQSPTIEPKSDQLLTRRNL